jgi:hypothetical protein
MLLPPLLLLGAACCCCMAASAALSGEVIATEGAAEARAAAAAAGLHEAPNCRGTVGSSGLARLAAAPRRALLPSCTGCCSATICACAAGVLVSPNTRCVGDRHGRVFVWLLVSTRIDAAAGSAAHTQWQHNKIAVWWRSKTATMQEGRR